MAWATWRAATEQALYGDGGFYRRTGAADGGSAGPIDSGGPVGPGAHFRTSVHASPLFARAVLSLADASGQSTVVDVGSGRGELLRGLRALDPTLRLVGVEVADRPADLPPDIDWLDRVPEGVEALVVANEWLDNVPVDVAQLTADGPRVVEVDTVTGAERVAGRLPSADAAWLDRWWPLQSVGGRAEVGRPRDDAWADVVRRLAHGVAVAVDYDHRRGERPAGGTLTGYRGGAQVAPVPDGSCDVTSHVALDACAAAGERAGARWTVLARQREVLQSLGVDGSLPDRDLAGRDPVAYLGRLSSASQAAELLGRGGLGDFGWLVQGVGVEVPALLARVR